MDNQHANDEARYQVRRKPVSTYNEPRDEGDRLAETAHEPLLPDNDENSSREARGNANESHWSASDDDTDHNPSRGPSLESQKEKSKKQSAEQKNPRTLNYWKTSTWNIFRAWWQEIVCCILSLIALVALVVLLAAFDGKPLPNWPSGITINTLVALLSTMARTAFVIPVVEGLSQSKWNWFKRKPRPLEDFDVFDQASRGPWGSLCLLLRTKGHLVGILSAVLLISGITTSTLTQSAVAYPSRNVSIQEEGSAVARRLYSTNWSNGQLNRERFLDSITMKTVERHISIYSGFIQGVLTPPRTILRFKEPECKTSHCTWPQFSTLAVCYKATNITHLIKYDEKDQNRNMTLPNGVSVADSRGSYFIIHPGPILSHDNETTLLSTGTATNYFIFSWNLDRTAYGGIEEPARGPRAIEVLFHMCVNTYDVGVEDNVISINRVASHTELHSEMFSPSNVAGGPAPHWRMYHFVTPADEGTNYTTPGLFLNSNLTNELRKTISPAPERYRLDASRALHDADMYHWSQKRKKAAELGRNTTIEDRDDAFWDAIEGMAHNIATSVTNLQIDEDPKYSWMTLINGTAWQREVYVQVRWPWLSMLAAQILLSAVLLAIVIAETAAADVDVVKSSVTVALLAIGADEKARLEGGGAADEGTRRLIPAGIGGELREKDGKWVLGGVDDS